MCGERGETLAGRLWTSCVEYLHGSVPGTAIDSAAGVMGLRARVEGPVFHPVRGG